MAWAQNVCDFEGHISIFLTSFLFSVQAPLYPIEVSKLKLKCLYNFLICCKLSKQILVIDLIDAGGKEGSRCHRIWISAFHFRAWDANLFSIFWILCKYSITIRISIWPLLTMHTRVWNLDSSQVTNIGVRVTLNGGILTAAVSVICFGQVIPYHYTSLQDSRILRRVIRTTPSN
jgi:hypothetical protein